MRWESRASLALLAGTLATGVWWVAPSAATSPVDSCEAAATLVKAGQLEEALVVARAVGEPCVSITEQGVKAARDAAANLVRQAQASEGDAKRLAMRALTLDAGNKEAAAITTAPPKVPSPCEEAEAALDAREYGRARTIFDALAAVESAKDCRATGLAKLAAVEAASPPARAISALTRDLVPTLLLLLGSFAFGVLLATFWRCHIRHARKALWVTGGMVLAAVGSLLVLLYPPGWIPAIGRWWDRSFPDAKEWSSHAGATWVALVFAAALIGAFAWVLSNHRRDTQPVSIDVSGDTNADFAELVIAEIQELGSGVSRGAFVPKGTDVSDSGIAAALGSGTVNSLVKMLLAVWKAVQLKSQDHVAVALGTPEKGTPSRAVASISRGSRMGSVRLVEARDFYIDRDTPSESELSSSRHDLATGVAAEVLISRMQPGQDDRLYGARDAKSIAFCTVAARRLTARDQSGARELYERGVDADPDNIAATYGVLAAQLRAYPKAEARKRLLRELARVKTDLIEMAKGQAEADKLPLMWRLWWLEVTGLVNGALTDAKDLNWKKLHEDENVRNAFRSAKKVSSRLIAYEERDIPKADRPLYRQLSENARVALAAINVLLAEPAGEGVPNLEEYPEVTDRAVQFNVACGFALLRVRAVGNELQGKAASLATECAERVRLAGGVEPWRGTLLRDPFMKLVEDSEDFRKLRKDWEETSPYDGIDSFGALAGDLSSFYRDPAALLAAIATLEGARMLQLQLKVDGSVTKQWKGAAEWLRRKQPADLINLYQKAGISDAATAQRLPEDEVVRRLEQARLLLGRSSIPSFSERRGMRL